MYSNYMPRAAYGYLVADQSPWERTRTAAYRLYANSICDTHKCHCSCGMPRVTPYKCNMPLHLTSIPLRHCTQYASLYSLGVNLGERPCPSPYNLHPFNVRLILPYLPYALLSLPLLLPLPYLGCKIPQRGLGLIPNRNRIWCT